MAPGALHGPGADGVDADVVGAQFLRQHARHAHHAHLGGGVIRGPIEAQTFNDGPGAQVKLPRIS